MKEISFGSASSRLGPLFEKILRKIEPVERVRVRDLVIQLAEDDESITSEALRQLREMGRSARTSLPWVKRLLLEDSSPEIRSRSLLTLLKISPRPARDIMRACRDQHRSIRLRLAHYFAYEWPGKDAELTAYLRSLVGLPFGDRLAEAFYLLRHPVRAKALGISNPRELGIVLFPEADEGVNEEKMLVYFLKDPDTEIRKLAALALGSIPWESERVNSALAKIVRNGEESVRDWALQSLEQRNISVFILLRSIAGDEEATPETRSWAVKRLARDHGNKAHAFFVTLRKLDSTPSDVQLAAIDAIATVKASKVTSLEGKSKSKQSSEILSEKNQSEENQTEVHGAVGNQTEEHQTDEHQGEEKQALA